MQGCEPTGDVGSPSITLVGDNSSPHSTLVRVDDVITKPARVRTYIVHGHGAAAAATVPHLVPASRENMQGKYAEKHTLSPPSI